MVGTFTVTSTKKSTLKLLELKYIMKIYAKRSY